MVSKSGGDFNKVQRLHRSLNYKSIKNASEKDILATIKHYKTTKNKVRQPKEIMKDVTHFYNKDIVSHQLPY